MAVLKARNPWIIVSQLIRSGEPEVEVREVEDFFSAIVVLLKRSIPPGLRAKALEILRDTNRRGKVIWGSIEPYVIFFYHLAFEIEFLEAAEELRKLIENSLRSSREASPKFSHKLFELVKKGYRYKRVSKDIEENKGAKKLIWIDLVKPTIYEKTALLRLIADIIFYKVTQLVPRSLDHDYRDVENEYDQLINIPVEEEVKDTYLIPRSNSISLVYKYFLRCARQIQIPNTYSIVFRNLREITSEIKQKKKALRLNKFIVTIGWVITFTLFGLIFFIVTWMVANFLGFLGSFLGATLNIIITILLQKWQLLESISQKIREKIINLKLRKLLSKQRELEEKLAGFFEF